MTYNGWTNYATWRVNMEMADDTVSMLIDERDTFDDAYALSECIDERVMSYLFDQPEMMRDYALAFLSDVNWSEIAETAITDNPELLESEGSQ